tara:strand:- start:582 stop:983 length:402 start_codon:yes stop_codon:yes gene_type:complete
VIYKKKSQHNDIKSIKQKEVERGRELDSGSLIAFSLAVGGTATIDKTITENPRSITVCNTHATLELLFTLKAKSTTGGSNFFMFNIVPIPAGSTLFLEGDEVSIISKTSEGYQLTFLITAASGTPGCDILIKT